MAMRLSLTWRRGLLATLAALLAAGALAIRFVPRRGIVKNDTQRVLWVVDTDTGSGVAHLLAPGRQSPRTLDADGVRSVDQAPIDEHGSWWKARDVSVAVVHEKDGALTLSCIGCSAVLDDEFGPVRYDRTPSWGEPTP
jgi:hypothetical protein